MFRKIKKGLIEAKENVSRNIEYARGRSDGFEHPVQTEPFIQVVQWNKDQLPKLLKRIDSLIRCEKELAKAEGKAYLDFSVVGGHQNENPQLEQYMKAFGDCENKISELRNVMILKFDEIRAEMKTRELKELDELKSVYEKANKALSDARYWKNNSSLFKLQEAESRYKQHIQELVELINRLVSTKETHYPAYLARIASAQVEFYSGASLIAQQYYNRLAEIGQVMLRGQPMIDMNFDLGSRELAEQISRASTTTVIVDPTSSNVIPTSTITTMQPQIQTQPMTNAKSVVALYDFVSNNPDELSFQKGDRIIVHQEVGQWWLGELNGRRGLIPANYVQ